MVKKKRKYTEGSNKESFSSNSSSNIASILKVQRKQKKNRYFLRSRVMEGALLEEVESARFLEILKAMSMSARIQKKSLDWTAVGTEMRKIRGRSKISQADLKRFLTYKHTEVQLFEELIQESGAHYCFLENHLKVDNGFWNNPYITGKYQRFHEFTNFLNLVDWMFVLPAVLDNNSSAPRCQRSTSRSTARHNTARHNTSSLDVISDPSIAAWNKLSTMYAMNEVRIGNDELQDLYEVFKKDKQDALCFLNSESFSGLPSGTMEAWLRRRIAEYFT